MNIKRGDICLAALDQVIRKEISKTRPQITAKKNHSLDTSVALMQSEGGQGGIPT